MPEELNDASSSSGDDFLKSLDNADDIQRVCGYSRICVIHKVVHCELCITSNKRMIRQRRCMDIINYEFSQRQCKDASPIFPKDGRMGEKLMFRGKLKIAAMILAFWVCVVFVVCCSLLSLLTVDDWWSKD